MDAHRSVEIDSGSGRRESGSICMSAVYVHVVIAKVRPRLLVNNPPFTRCELLARRTAIARIPILHGLSLSVALSSTQ